jgi:ATP adenylyltransferase
MERLWSPWRSEFINAAKDSSGGGSPFFKAFNQPEKDEENFLLHRGERAFIILNRYPYNAGHLLVLPVREVGDFLVLDEAERNEMMNLIRFGIQMLTLAMKPDAFNVGMNLGRSAGAGIESHVHFHVVPRWNGDTNFMPVIGEVRMISENMQEAYRKLVEARDTLMLRSQQ